MSASFQKILIQKQLESENSAKMEVLWNDSEELQAANSLLNQEFGTIVNRVPSILMDRSLSD